jgi:hypothetical protein
MLSKTFAPGAVNLNVEVSLLKYCPPITSQGGMGSCAQWGVAEADFITRNAAQDRKGNRMNAELAHAGFLYERVRRMRGWFPNDTGSWPSDGFDILLNDKPLASRAPYMQNAAFDYDDNLFRNPKPIDDLQSHRPFFVHEGNALEQLQAALQAGMAVTCCMYWSNAYTDPPGGRLPEGVQWDPNRGHCLTLRGRTPDRGGVVAALNHWTEFWNPGVVALGFDFRPGEVAIPDSFFLPNTNSPIFELRAASPEPVEFEGVIIPPETEPVITGVKLKGHKKLFITGSGFHAQAAVSIDGAPQRTKRKDDRLLVPDVRLAIGRRMIRVVNPNATSKAWPYDVA